MPLNRKSTKPMVQMYIKPHNYVFHSWQKIPIIFHRNTLAPVSYKQFCGTLNNMSRLSLIRVFAVRMKKAWVLSYPRAHSEDSDQTGRMPRLIWVFAGRTVILLVLSWCGSYTERQKKRPHIYICFFFLPLYRFQLSIADNLSPVTRKTCLRGFRPGKTQTGLLSFRD